MDILIVSTGTAAQETYWQDQLARLRGTLIPDTMLAVAVHEDWAGGAGNGLGTLYAYLKGRDKVRQLYSKDIQEEQKNGGAVAIYHTAGQGKRLAPLTASEYFNKSAVKLPALVHGRPLSILEAVIRQTSVFLGSRPSRLSVFWGDQLFQPTRFPQYTPEYHIDILAMLQPFPNESDWNRKQLHNYGLIAIDSNGAAKNLEKSSYVDIQKLLQTRSLSVEGGFGVSLGSFSLSYPMTIALLDLFNAELQQKKIKLDSDTHFWMAMTWDQCQQVEPAHHARMQKFKSEFLNKHPEMELFGTVDIGADSYWWDYGSIKNYFVNNLKLTRQDAEGHAMRQQLGVSSTLINCNIKSGNIVNSVLVGVQADHLDVRDCVIINSNFSRLEAQSCLLYNVQATQALQLPQNTVRADVHLDNKNMSFYTTLDNDGKADWNKTLENNVLSYEELHEKCAQSALKSVETSKDALRKNNL